MLIRFLLNSFSFSFSNPFVFVLSNQFVFVVCLVFHSKEKLTLRCPKHRSEGFPLAAYFIPGRDGMGAWPNSKIVGASSSLSVTNTSKTYKKKRGKNTKNLTIGP